MSEPSPLPRNRLRATFASLAVRNYRLYFFGQVASRVGTWFQVVALAWFTLELTGSATWVGVVLGAQTLPLLVLTPYGGVLADRFDTRRLLLWVQAGRLVVSLGLAGLAWSGSDALWLLLALAVLSGAGQALDSPARQVLVHALVGPGLLRNAVSLNSVLANTARALGPALAGLVIVWSGTPLCFLLDAVSYLVLAGALLLMDRSALHSSEVSGAVPRIRDALSHVRRHRVLLLPLVVMAVVGTLTYEFPVTLPFFAVDGLGGDARTYGTLMSAMAAGAITGAFWAASRRDYSRWELPLSAGTFGFLVVLAALSPVLWVALCVLYLVGAAGVVFTTSAVSTLQLAAAPAVRGRVMALWVVAHQGSTAVGAPLIGYVAEHAGARAALGVGGVAALVAAVGAAAALSFRR